MLMLLLFSLAPVLLMLMRKMEDTCPDSKSLFSLAQIIQEDILTASSKTIHSCEQSKKSFITANIFPENEKSRSEEKVCPCTRCAKL